MSKATSLFSPLIIFSASPSTSQIPAPNSHLRFPAAASLRGGGRLHLLRRKKCAVISCSGSVDAPDADEDVAGVELGRLLALLPEEMRLRVVQHPEAEDLMEVVMDLGRKPLARFPSGDFILSESLITFKDLELATSMVGDFAIDNRAGISRTLHRISAIRNRKGLIIGLTCRVGRAVSGSASLLRDLVKDGASLLLIGPPGVGKTTIIRDIARMLANDYKKRVMIVDTSNEIGGDGDIPHSGIGTARRMQVPNADKQHMVLIEAVENHMPQVIVIDEIGTKLEAMAASTIAQRGIQLVATAHGVTIENLIMNPSLEMLVGGIQSVTLGDEEASRRRVQKTVLERKGPSTFNSGVEIISKTELRIYRSLEETVDAILAGRSPRVEIRKMNAQAFDGSDERDTFSFEAPDEEHDIAPEDVPDNDVIAERTADEAISVDFPSSTAEDCGEDEKTTLRLFVYGILEASLLQVTHQVKSDYRIQVTDNISEADAILALQPKLKKNSRIQAVAKAHDIPIAVIKTNSLVQITKAVRSLVNDHADKLDANGSEDAVNMTERIDALQEARVAIEQVVIPKGEPAELLPRPSSIISLQISLIRKYRLQWEKLDGEPNAQLRILPFISKVNIEDKPNDENKDDYGDDDLTEMMGITSLMVLLVTQMVQLLWLRDYLFFPTSLQTCLCKYHFKTSLCAIYHFKTLTKKLMM
uniref:AAA+ ATPase domain-containing protein n=1 Tax=Kalanchoe fedtschenkoi TaxID=63787 RepID=A0A7N0T6D2_KALFE